MSPAMTLNGHHNARINCAFTPRFVPPSRQQFHRGGKGAVPTPSSLGARAAVVALLVAGSEPLLPSEGTATAPGGSVGASQLPPVPGRQRPRQRRSCLRLSYGSMGCVNWLPICSRHLSAAARGALYVTVICWQRGAAPFPPPRRKRKVERGAGRLARWPDNLVLTLPPLALIREASQHRLFVLMPACRAAASSGSRCATAL